ncbi:hypothetical protein EDEG_03652 [Edhazardia aedis USNM 41457]|uniref:Uncharacterized protein n=1 Tax=Edhazardia aedis (strain USNM 41457) TaxID=1003232 RepID=J8ZQA7_EDHAE|nr:hypothetical protein EDEG_03652 [Edhazardia aedis USNM 41457]|eukprot:EJW01878.1 hypothetical protein EDEG_03652 [Edhazardia aedis USNM 41457]
MNYIYSYKDIIEKNFTYTCIVKYSCVHKNKQSILKLKSNTSSIFHKNIFNKNCFRKIQSFETFFIAVAYQCIKFTFDLNGYFSNFILELFRYFSLYLKLKKIKYIGNIYLVNYFITKIS